MESGIFNSKISGSGGDKVFFKVRFVAFNDFGWDVVVFFDFFHGFGHQVDVAINVNLLCSILRKHGKLMSDGAINVLKLAGFYLFFVLNGVRTTQRNPERHLWLQPFSQKLCFMRTLAVNLNHVKFLSILKGERLERDGKNQIEPAEFAAGDTFFDADEIKSNAKSRVGVMGIVGFISNLVLHHVEHGSLANRAGNGNHAGMPLLKGVVCKKTEISGGNKIKSLLKTSGNTHTSIISKKPLLWGLFITYSLHLDLCVNAGWEREILERINRLRGGV